MSPNKTALLIATTMMMMSMGPAIAQGEHAGHGATAPAVDASLVAQLPAICLTAQADQMAPMAMGHDMTPAQSDLMAGMDENNNLMMAAGMVDDIDVAFICSMIPHHQSAINMAKAELEHGDNAWAKSMAHKIIDAQEAEIGEMVAWLEAEGAAE